MKIEVIRNEKSPFDGSVRIDGAPVEHCYSCVVSLQAGQQPSAVVTLFGDNLNFETQIRGDCAEVWVIFAASKRLTSDGSLEIQPGERYRLVDPRDCDIVPRYHTMLGDRLPALFEEAVRWIYNDMWYKAPEQLDDPDVYMRWVGRLIESFRSVKQREDRKPSRRE